MKIDNENQVDNRKGEFYWIWKVCTYDVYTWMKNPRRGNYKN